VFSDHKIAYMRKHVKIRKAERLSFLRQSVAYVLSLSARQIPHASMVSHLDCTPLVNYGKERDGHIAAEAECLSDKVLLRRAIHRNFSAFYLKALAHSLYHVPRLNGFLEYTPWRNGGTFYEAEDINISFTVHTNHGVVGPVLRNAHQKTLEEVASEMRVLARKARWTDPEELYWRAAKQLVKIAVWELDFHNFPALWMLLRYALCGRKRFNPKYADVPMEDRLQVADVFGATCVLANIGMVVQGFHTLNVVLPPAVMVFGIGDISLQPRVVDGQVVPRHVVTINGTMDHRAFDGGDGFPIQGHLDRYFGHPELLYEWKQGDPV